MDPPVRADIDRPPPLRGNGAYVVELRLAAPRLLGELVRVVEGRWYEEESFTRSSNDSTARRRDLCQPAVTVLVLLA